MRGPLFTWAPAASGLALCLGLCLGLAGCVAPEPPPVVAYAHENCVARPELAMAVSLASQKLEVSHSVLGKLDATTPCLHRENGDTPYQVFALPGDVEGKTMMVGSAVGVNRLLPPDVSLLDADGKVTRTFAAGDYMFRGALYAVQFRPHVGEAYVLVAVDRSRVGSTYSSIAIGTSTTTSSTGRATVSWTTGTDKASTRVFGYEGAIEVTVYDPAAAKPR